MYISTKIFKKIFLSTLSLRRATFIAFSIAKSTKFLSTLSLRRATPALHNIFELLAISIHALLAESDAGKGPAVKGYRNFYPRSPCGERPMGLDGRFKL